MKSSSKIIPNNGPLARQARRGEVVTVHRPKESRGTFKPWSLKQPAYDRWFRDLMDGERCQCPVPWCPRNGNEVHHEHFGKEKDDRSICWLSLYCHQVIRHGERGHEDAGHPNHVWTAEQFAAGCASAALDNWLRYCSAMEHTEAKGMERK